MQVKFTQMQDGSAADYDLIDKHDLETARRLPDRILAQLRLMAEDQGAYQIDRLQHVLQTATRAERDGADQDWIIAALLHDIGDGLAPFCHGDYAAEILRPFIRDDVCWVVRHHPIFQQHYFANRPDSEREARQRFCGHAHYQLAIDFCQNWDQCSFDPGYETLSLEHFEPMLRRVFAREPFNRT